VAGDGRVLLVESLLRRQSRTQVRVRLRPHLLPVVDARERNLPPPGRGHRPPGADIQVHASSRDLEDHVQLCRRYSAQ